MSEHNSDLEGQLAQRVERMDKLRARGINTFANDFRVNAFLSDVYAFAGEVPTQDQIINGAHRYSLAGRLIQVNDFGSIRFLFIRDGYNTLVQGLIRKKDNPEQYELAKDLHLGDIIGFTGPLFKTKQDKRAILVEKLQLLTKSLRPLPGKVLQDNQDVNDKELLYRKRYLDFIQHPDKLIVFKRRADIIAAIRKTLNDRRFIEVETRTLQPIAGGATAKPFITKHNAIDQDMYLRIAPELDLKRLVVGGMERVYELGKNWRNEGLSPKHNPEFTAIEAYQAYATYEHAMDLVEDIFHMAAYGATGQANRFIEYQGQQIELFNEDKQRKFFARKTMLQSVLEVKPDLPDNERYGLKLVEAFERLVEPNLIQPTFITQYPIEVSPLARCNESDPRFTDRFELFIAGMEVANGFSELNDPVDQYNRFVEQGKKKVGGDAEAMDMDQDYIEALQYGLPPTAGFGIGIDRLAMVLTNQRSIKDVILFPAYKQV